MSASTRWERGKTTVAPFSSVKSLRANMQLTVSSTPGRRASGQLPSSRCHTWPGSPGPTAITCPVLSQ